VRLLTLNRLPPRRRSQIISGVVGGKALPKEIAGQIIERTDGIPSSIPCFSNRSFDIQGSPP
jgi:hypothetical protein